MNKQMYKVWIGENDLVETVQAKDPKIAIDLYIKHYNLCKDQQLRVNVIFISYDLIK